MSACPTWASRPGFQSALTPLGTKGTAGGLARQSSFRLILILEGSLAVWTLLASPMGRPLGLGGPSLSSSDLITVTVAQQDSWAEAGHSSVSKEARWVEREEAREQQVDARNSQSLGALPSAYTTLPHRGPLTVAARLGALRQCSGITDTWQPFDKAAPLNKHRELNGPGLQGWAGTLSPSPYRTKTGRKSQGQQNWDKKYNFPISQYNLSSVLKNL